MPAAFSSAGFRRHWWLFSAHLETAAALAEKETLPYQSRIAATPDRDEVRVNWLAGKPGMPLLVIFHGLEGCAQSRSVRALAKPFWARGWHVAAPHFRSCGHPNLLPRAYHAADGADARWFIEYFRAMFGAPPTFAAGVSLGGCALIQCLDGEDAPPVRAAAAVSVPLNLPAAARRISRGLSHFLYGRHFIKLLRAKLAKKTERYPALCDAQEFRGIRTVADFDRVYTAPVHGFIGAEDYWQNGSAEKALRRMKTPLLCINAQNDPLAPPDISPDDASENVAFCRPKHGGHGAFFGAPADWLGDTVHDFFAAQLKADAP